MTEMRLDFPVYTLDGQLLASAQTTLSDEAVSHLLSQGRGPSLETVSLFQYNTFRQDLVHYLTHQPYSAIFDDPQKTSLLMGLMERARLPVPVLKSLNYFKENDHYTYRHTLMVFALSTLMAQDLVCSDHDLLQEALAGPVHDFGKVCVPLHILRKSQPLTRTERGILEHHAGAGFVLLTHYLGDRNSFGARAARDHHERGDGSGYPSQVRLKDRMVEIIAASDVYDALISPRPYRPASYDNRTALEELTELATQGKLNWEVIRTLIAYNRKTKPHYTDCVVSAEKRGIPPSGNLYGLIRDEDPQPIP